jgi:hypothetical protein
MIFFGREDPDEPDWSQAWGPPLTPEEEARIAAMAREMGTQAGRYVDEMLLSLLVGSGP